MIVRPMELTFAQELTSSGTRRTIRLTNIQDNLRDHVIIYFDMIGEITAPEPRVLDGFIFGIIFYAMYLGQNVHVHGALSRECMRNLNEFQEAWVCWKGAHYKKIQVIADTILDAPNTDGRDDAIAAFSGGGGLGFHIASPRDKQIGCGRLSSEKFSTNGSWF